MRKCDTVFTIGQCPGHFGGKYEDCATQGLDALGLDYADDETGSTQYEGHLMLFLLDETTGADLDGDGKLIAHIPAGSYILFTTESGNVSLWRYGSHAIVIDEFERWAIRYSNWEREYA